MWDRRSLIVWIVFGVLVALIQIDAMRTAFEVLGATPGGAGLLLVGSVLGSGMSFPAASLVSPATSTG